MITMTDTAAKKVSELRLEEGKPEWGLRIRIVGGGCSGMSYELGWEDQQHADDNVVEAAQGIKVYIDKNSAAYLSGSEIDFVQNDMMGAGFPGKRSSPAIPISRATARTPSSRSATTTSNPITASPPTTSSACSRR